MPKDTIGQTESHRPTRREVIVGLISTAVATSIFPPTPADADLAYPALRAINIMNFIRAEEPREKMDLFSPVREQMAQIKAYGFPATWLLQYDALVEGPFVEFLKAEMQPNHEVGIWFEMNRKICEDAGIAWRGNPDWEWDYHVPVAYAIGYTPEERRKLADTAMATFKRVFGRSARTIASWNLDAVSVEHLTNHYKIDAFGNCRDQLATDGFTIWGAPIAGYYPSTVNAWSPAVNRKNQLKTPIFRLLGQDPVYYYDNRIPYPDTMEPVWASGQSEVFVDNFLEMIAVHPSCQFAYAQLGQENSFGWPAMQVGYPMQMEKLAHISKMDGVVVETMGETGRRFKRAFKTTPPQAQVMLNDPFGHKIEPQRTIWYQSRFLRANLHFRNREFYLRDLQVYNDLYPQPYLTVPATIHGIEQRMLAVLDGYHWSDDNVQAGKPGTRAAGRFARVDDSGTVTPLEMDGSPVVTETANSLTATVSLSSGGAVDVQFSERELGFRVTGTPKQARLQLIFDWVTDRSALHSVEPHQLHYSYRDFAYHVRVVNGVANATKSGVVITAGKSGTLTLRMAQ